MRSTASAVGELAAIVDAQRLLGVGEKHRLDVSTEQGQHVGEVVLALGVVVADACKGRPEPGAVEHVHARPHLRGGNGPGRQVALLDGAHHPARLRVPVDPAEPSRVRRHRREQGGGGSACGGGGR